MPLAHREEGALEATRPLIRLHEVTRRYGDHAALRGVTFDIPAGRTGLLGPNGAGKSSLLKILLGLLPPSSGGGEVLGQPLAPPEGRQGSLSLIRHDLLGTGMALRRAIGYMPEADCLVPGLRGADYVALAG